MVLFLVLFAVRSQEIIKEFGEIIVPLNDSQTFHLEEYFSGDFLKYFIECSRNDSAIVQITQGYGQTLILNSKNDSLSFNEMVFRYRMPSIWNDSKHYSFYYDKSKVFVILTTFDPLKSELFHIFDFSDKPMFTVLGLSSLKLADTINLFVFGWSNKLQKNLFFIVDMTSFEMNSVIISKLEKIEDLRIDSNVNSSYLCLNGTFEQVVSLFVLKFQENLDSPELFNISEFLTIPKYIKTPVSVTSYFLIDPSPSPEPITLVVIDKSSNFIYFTMDSINYTEHYSLPLGLYGQPSEVQLVIDLSSGVKFFIVMTTKGVLAINYENRSIFALWPYPSNVDQVVGVYYEINFMYFFHIIENSRLAITVSSIQNTKDIQYSTLLGFKQVNTEGPWCFIEFLEKITFLHLDYSTVNAVRLEIFDPSLDICIANDSIECDVIAINQVDKKNVKNSIKLVNLNSSLYQISKIYQGKEYSEELEISIQISKIVNFEKLPIYMITGWNTTCSFDQVFTENLRITDSTLNKVQKTTSLNFGNCSKVFVQYKFLICTYKDHLVLANVTEENGYTFNISNIIQVQVSGINETVNYFALLCKYQEKYLLKVLIVDHYNYDRPFDDYEVDKTLTGNVIIETFESFIFIFDQNYIFVLNLDQISMKFQYFYSIQSNSFENPIKNIAIFQVPKFEYLLNVYIVLPNSIRIFILNTLNQGYSNISSSLKKDISGCIKVLVSNEEIYIHLPSKIMVYDYMLIQNIRQINIALFESLILDSFLVGKSSDSLLYVINGTESFKIESVYYLENTTNKLIGFSLDSKNHSIVVLQSSENIIFYSLLCPSNIGECGKDLIMKIELTNEKEINNSIQTTQLNLYCTNLFYTQNFSYSLTIYLLGLNIDPNTIKLSLHYNYQDQALYNLSEIFGGYDLSYSLDFPDFNFNSTQIQPISVINSISVIRTIELNAVITGFTLIKNTSLVAVTFSDNRIIIFDLFTADEKTNFNFSFEYNLTCPLVQYVSYKSEILLFVGVCFNYTEDLIRKSFLKVTLVNSSTLRIVSHHIPLNSSYSILKVIQATETLFLIALIEDQPITFNNNIEIFKGTWIKELIIEYFELINFYTLNLLYTCFTSIEGEFDYTGSITLYLVDQLYGVRIVKNIDNTFKLSGGIPVSCNFTSMALCSHQLYLGCLDTSVFLYKQSNGKFSFLNRFYPYNREEPFQAMIGYMDCNDYYHSKYVIMPIVKNQSYSIRVLNTFNNLESQILKDIKISDKPPQEDCSTKVKFYNVSDFVAFDSFGQKIMIFRINEPSLIIPKLSKDQYEKILEVTNGRPVSFYLNVYNKLTSIVPQRCYLERGNLDDDSNYHEYHIPAYAFIIGSLGFLIIMAGCAFAGYKIFKTCEVKKDLTLFEEKSEGVSFVFSARSIN